MPAHFTRQLQMLLVAKERDDWHFSDLSCAWDALEQEVLAMGAMLEVEVVFY